MVYAARAVTLQYTGAEKVIFSMLNAETLTLINLGVSSFYLRWYTTAKIKILLTKLHTVLSP